MTTSFAETTVTMSAARLDEKMLQAAFYTKLYGERWNEIVNLSRNTDGFLPGIIFEHKRNASNYGLSKALSQVIIYLTRFNRDGIHVPRYTCLVSHEESTCYFYDNEYYIDYINDIDSYAQLVPSNGINDFPVILDSASLVNTVTFNLEDGQAMLALKSYINKLNNKFAKISINSFNVVGWSKYYYNHCPRGKAKKIQFFNELRKPAAVLGLYITPWLGQERDFEYIMDMLNDPAEQKKIGAFYTPEEYARQACELVKQAIARVPAGNDYVIIDRCAGTGNLEWVLNDVIANDEDLLSHVIVSSPELKEWEVLRERLGKRVRHLLPEGEIEVTDTGYLRGADALSEEFLNNPTIKRYIDDPKCSIILFENPPYAQGSSVTNQKNKIGTEACDWKNSYVVSKMIKEISGTASNELCNAFIWSGFRKTWLNIVLFRK